MLRIPTPEDLAGCLPGSIYDAASLKWPQEAHPRDPFSALLTGNTGEHRRLNPGQRRRICEERVAAAQLLFSLLFPEEYREELEKSSGIQVLCMLYVGAPGSQKFPDRPKLFLTFQRRNVHGPKHCSAVQCEEITCELATRRLVTGSGEEDLHSIEQVQQKIQEAIQAFA